MGKKIKYSDRPESKASLNFMPARMNLPSFFYSEEFESQLEQFLPNDWNSVVEMVNQGEIPPLNEILKYEVRLERNLEEVEEKLDSLKVYLIECSNLIDEYSAQTKIVDLPNPVLGFRLIGMQWEGASTDYELRNAIGSYSVDISLQDVLDEVNRLGERTRRHHSRTKNTVELLRYKVGIIENVLWQKYVIGEVKKWEELTPEERSDTWTPFLLPGQIERAKRDENICTRYLELKESGLTKVKAIEKIATEVNLAFDTVRGIVDKKLKFLGSDH